MEKRYPAYFTAHHWSTHSFTVCNQSRFPALLRREKLETLSDIDAIIERRRQKAPGSSDSSRILPKRPAVRRG